MKKSKFLVSFRSSTSEVSKDGNVYHKVSLQSFAEKVDDKWIANDTLDFIRVSNLTFEMWFKGKTMPSNILMLDVEYRVAGVTEYTVDGIVKKHTSTSVECVSCVQATLYDIIDVAEYVNIERYKTTMFNAIKMANIISNRF